MRSDGVAILIIGTELTEGIIQDSHAKFLTSRLTELFFHVNEIVTIADDNSINEILSKLVNKHSVIIVTGGLGPTGDDMTRNSIAELAHVPLVKDEESFERLYKKVGERIHGANEKQAWFPKGFTPIVNPYGTADAFYGYCGSSLLFALPGPPREAHPLFEDEVVNILIRLNNIKVEKREEYSTFLIPEAKLEDACNIVDPTLNWGTRFQDYKISLFLSGGDKARRENAIVKLKGILGSQLLLDGNVDILNLVTEKLCSKGETVSVAESCTGGFLAKLLTDKGGSSLYFKGGVVSYSESVKKNLLGVRESTIREFGQVSEECAVEMAEGVLKLINSDYSVSVTGVAGPGESEGKKVGTVCFSIASKKYQSYSVKLEFMSISRDATRRRACVAGLLLLNEYIDKMGLVDIKGGWPYI